MLEFIKNMFIKKKVLTINKKKENITITKLPYNPFFEKISQYYLKFNKKDKAFTLILLKYTEKSGASLRKGIINKIKETRNKKNFIMEYLLLKVLYYLDVKGLKIVDALYEATFINQKEKSILQKSRSFAEGIDQIANLSKRTSKLFVYNTMLLAPAYIMLVVLLCTHGTIKDVLEGMVRPIKDAGGTPPPLPHYMVDPSLYITYNIMFFTLLAIILLFYYYTKFYNLPLYFKTFVFNEQEKTLEVLESMSSLLNSGINLTDSVKILLDDEEDVVKKTLYEEIYINFIKGKIELSQIFEYYNVNYSTIGLISMGEETNNILETLNNAKSALSETYDLNMKIYSKISFYGGQLLMGMVFLKPLIDILLYTSIQQLNFST